MGLKSMVVGGDWGAGPEEHRESKIAAIFAKYLDAELHNGGNSHNLLKHPRLEDKDLVIWMPNVPNGEVKRYPKKKRGSVLICSKVMREGYRRADSVSRIFKMHGNAVIEIWQTGSRHTFKLVDALGNVWQESQDIPEIVDAILRLCEWSRGQIRMPSAIADIATDLQRLLYTSSRVAGRVQDKLGERYFGNVSTRCQALFPSMRSSETIFVSPRNSDKKILREEDMVVAKWVDNDKVVGYQGRSGNRPSVDTPVQLSIYKSRPWINFMIHGHAEIEGALCTDHYYPCGDMREVEGILKLIHPRWKGEGAINLKNHGFLLFSSTIDDMEDLCEWVSFEEDPWNWSLL